MATQFSLIESEHVLSLPIHIIGVGGSGSHLALELAKLGVGTIHIHDPKHVSDYNWRNQRYAPSHAGRLKVEVLAEKMTLEGSDTYVVAHPVAVGEGTPLSGIVFFCTDSMRSRSEVFNQCIRDVNTVELLIDTRMTASYIRILTLDPRTDLGREMWDHNCHTDADADNDTASCGSPIGVGPTSAFIASTAAWQLIRYDMQLRGERVLLPNEITFDLKLLTPPEFLVWE